MALSPAPNHPDCLRIAAAGDLHRSEDRAAEIAESFAALRGTADLVLLAGDLTTHGEPEEAVPLAAACTKLEIPVLAVLGNHDWHADRTHELGAVLADGGITLLDGAARILTIRGHEVGVAGVKGFVGGFSGSHLPDFGEPVLRDVYRATSRDVEALERGLEEIELCATRIALMHYAPTASTILGEELGIWAFLGSDRLAAPITQHEPDLVLHGHAHGGTFEGEIGRTPVYNVAIPVTGRDFWLFELDVSSPVRMPIR